MPLIWERDEAEENIYQQSLAEPGKRFVVCENTQGITFYIDGKKCAAHKKMKVERSKSKPYHDNGLGSELRDWETDPQISFNFMHPYWKKDLLVKWSPLDLSFENKQLSLVLE